VSSLHEQVDAWLEQDPDEGTRAELAALHETAASDGAAAAELADRFAGRLEFGTAGLRGALGAGPNRMNRVVVAQAAAGLVAYLDGEDRDGPVVVGHDARHRSDVFARDTVELVAASGRRALLLPGPLPTPVLAFAIRHLGCAAGVMVTASHNPRADNGYKVYLGDGSQIVPPADAGIAAAIAAVGRVDALPRSPDWELLDAGVAAAYVDAVAGLDPAAPGPRLRVVHTSLHGVGAATVRAVLARVGGVELHEVPQQSEPDADFPTVPFPNPEEPGALDLALELADRVGADLVVANDPDADRCAVAVPAARGWHPLSGDELGVLLGDDALRRGVGGTFATTIVSSSLLGRMCAAGGAPYVETLTGFKWLGRVPGLVYAYEEALGYCVAPQIAADKDGISAAVRVLALARELRGRGASLLDRLDEIAADHGVHATDQLSVRVADVALVAALLARLRSAPPTTLGGLEVLQVDDLGAGSSDLPATPGLRLRLRHGARVVIRPSGTEPKLKCYLEVVLAPAGAVPAARTAAADRLAAVRRDLAAALGV
jgi:phosphomannomutase